MCGSCGAWQAFKHYQAMGDQARKGWGPGAQGIRCLGNFWLLYIFCSPVFKNGHRTSCVGIRCSRIFLAGELVIEATKCLKPVPMKDRLLDKWVAGWVTRLEAVWWMGGWVVIP